MPKSILIVAKKWAICLMIILFRTWSSYMRLIDRYFQRPKEVTALKKFDLIESTANLMHQRELRKGSSRTLSCDLLSVGPMSKQFLIATNTHRNRKTLGLRTRFFDIFDVVSKNIPIIKWSVLSHCFSYERRLPLTVIDGTLACECRNKREMVNMTPFTY